MEVAVKTVLFSSASEPEGETAPSSSGEGSTSSTTGKGHGQGPGYEQAIKEAAVCSSLAHRNVVRARVLGLMLGWLV